MPTGGMEGPGPRLPPLLVVLKDAGEVSDDSSLGVGDLERKRRPQVSEGFLIGFQDIWRRLESEVTTLRGTTICAACDTNPVIRGACCFRPTS